MSQEKNDLEKINILIAGIKKGCELGKFKFEEIGTLYICVTKVIVEENDNIVFKYNKENVINIINGIEIANNRGGFSLDESAMLLEAVNYFKNYENKNCISK